ncbi:MAG: hypothetical protein OXC44_07885 [Proteobacteria bacterium]|nr:hypothetical protein [Pseudomonadota bacterium]
MIYSSSGPPSSVDYFSQDLLVHADQAFQFAYGLTFNREYSSECVYSTYKSFAEDLPVPRGDDGQGLVTVFQKMWSLISRQEGAFELMSAADDVSASQDSSASEHSEQENATAEGGDSTTSSGDVLDTVTEQKEGLLFSLVLSSLSLKERAVLILCDHFGLSKAECGWVIGDKKEENILKLLAHGRLQLMAQSF